VKNTFNACDSSDDSTFVPRAQRHGAVVGLHQDLNDSITLDLRGFYGQRKSRSFSPLRGQATVTPSNAFYIPLADNPTANQQVLFTFAPVLGNDSAPSGTSFKEWGANAEVGAKLFGDWQLRTLLNYSHSDSRFFITSLNQNLLTAAGRSANPLTAVNFYDPAATPNLDLIREIANSEI